MSSKSEAFGLVTIEAMKLSIPVIGRASGANIELITNGFNGFLYKPNNIDEISALPGIFNKKS